MYSSQLLGDDVDYFPEENHVLKGHGFQVRITPGFQCWEWEVLRTKSFGQDIQEFTTWVGFLSGTADTTRNAFIFAVQELSDVEHDPQILYDVSFYQKRDE